MGMKPASRRYRNRPNAPIDWTHYDPHPPNVLNVELSGFVESVLPTVAEKTHDAWLLEYRKGIKSLLEHGGISKEEAGLSLNEPRVKPWYKLDPAIQQRYIRDAKVHLQAMQYMGYELDEVLPGDVVQSDTQGMLSVEAAEASASLLHAAWCRAKLDQGYVYGPSFNDNPAAGPLTNPDLVEYKYLGGFDPNEMDYEKIKEMEWSRDIRQSLRFKPIMTTLNYALGSGNFQIIRSESGYGPEQRGQGRKPRSSADLDRAMSGIEHPEFGSYEFGIDT